MAELILFHHEKKAFSTEESFIKVMKFALNNGEIANLGPHILGQLLGGTMAHSGFKFDPYSLGNRKRLVVTVAHEIGHNILAFGKGTADSAVDEFAAYIAEGAMLQILGLSADEINRYLKDWFLTAFDMQDSVNEPHKAAWTVLDRMIEAASDFSHSINWLELLEQIIKNPPAIGERFLDYSQRFVVSYFAVKSKNATQKFETSEILKRLKIPPMAFKGRYGLISPGDIKTIINYYWPLLPSLVFGVMFNYWSDQPGDIQSASILNGSWMVAWGVGIWVSESLKFYRQKQVDQKSLFVDVEGTHGGQQVETSDSAIKKDQKLAPGGIDITNIPLQIKRDQNGVPLPLPLQNISIIHLEGLTPVILDDQPATFQVLPFILSLKEKEPQLRRNQF